MLNITHVSKSFFDGVESRPVLSDISLTLAAGQSLSLLGRSGSGKTTLLNLISGLEKPSSGNLTLDNYRIDSANADDLALFRREHIGFVFQSFNLLPYLTVIENISLSLRMLRQWTPEQQQHVSSLMAHVGIEHLSHRLPEKLSGGEKQRVALVRALSHKPKLILADEPTGNLDGANVQIVTDLLFKLSKERNAMLIVVTHDEELAKRSDHVLRIKEGSLHAC